MNQKQAKKKRIGHEEYIFYSTYENSRSNWLEFFAREIKPYPKWIKSYKDSLATVTNTIRTYYPCSLFGSLYRSGYYRFPVLNEPHCLKYTLSVLVHHDDVWFQ